MAMTDVVDKATRSRMMRGIRGKDTKPELLIRKALFARGFRYRLHDKRLPGKPDLVFPAYNAVVFVHGCFWHGHKCHLFKWPQTRKEFWRKKINRNRAVDRQAVRRLKEQGWYVLTVWECAIKGKKRKPLNKVADRISRWLETGKMDLEISG
jgi:DNA mismatch endonuclease (patch repair protein)